MKVALVCDWLLGIGGAEKVALAFHQMYPSAPIYTSQYDPKKIDWFSSADVRTGWLNKLPKGLKKFLPILRANYFKNLDLSEYDLVISINMSEAKGVKTGKNTTHVCYMQGPPTQYYWGMYDEYIKNPGFGKLDFLARIGLKTFGKRQRKIDYKFAQNPDHMIAISTYVQDEIKKYYGRDSEIVHPPVNVDEFKVDKKYDKQGFVIAGRQTPWKRMDLAIEACKSTGDKLVVVGDGPEHSRLVKLASGCSNIEFIPAYNGAKEIKQVFASARAFIFPSVEPFGITPIEAMATGTPAIALKKGGALDIVKQGENGIFFDRQTKASLVKAIEKFNKAKFDSKKVIASTKQFSEAEFKKQMKECINKCLSK